MRFLLPKPKSKESSSSSSSSYSMRFLLPKPKSKESSSSSSSSSYSMRFLLPKSPSRSLGQVKVPSLSMPGSSIDSSKSPPSSPPGPCPGTSSPPGPWPGTSSPPGPWPGTSSPPDPWPGTSSPPDSWPGTSSPRDPCFSPLQHRWNGEGAAPAALHITNASAPYCRTTVLAGTRVCLEQRAVCLEQGPASRRIHWTLKRTPQLHVVRISREATLCLSNRNNTWGCKSSQADKGSQGNATDSLLHVLIRASTHVNTNVFLLLCSVYVYVCVIVCLKLACSMFWVCFDF